MSDTTTCIVCKNQWNGLRACHCGSCHQTFAGIELFDRHRRHYREHSWCLDPHSIRDQAGQPVMFHREGQWRGSEFYTSPTPPRSTRSD